MNRLSVQQQKPQVHAGKNNSGRRQSTPSRSQCISESFQRQQELNDQVSTSREAFEEREASRNEGMGGLLNGVSDWFTGADELREAGQQEIEESIRTSGERANVTETRSCLRRAWAGQNPQRSQTGPYPRFEYEARLFTLIRP